MSRIFSEHTLDKDYDSLEESQLLYKLILMKLSRKEHLNRDEIAVVIRNIMEGKCSDVFISALLMGLVIKSNAPGYQGE